MGETDFSASEAKRLGLTFEVNVSNGYVAGGPWITKKLSMQKVVASDTVVSGNCRFSGRLPLPTSQSEFWDFAVIAFPDYWNCGNELEQETGIVF